MEYLYVCHFSNGHIKVGRSIHPKSRIASHADRVALDAWNANRMAEKAA